MIISWGGTDQFWTRMSTISYLSVQGRMKKMPGPLSPPPRIRPSRKMTTFSYSWIEQDEWCLAAGHKCYFLDNFETAEKGEGSRDDDQEDGGGGQEPGEHQGRLLAHLVSRHHLLQHPRLLRLGLLGRQLGNLQSFYVATNPNKNTMTDKFNFVNAFTLFFPAVIVIFMPSIN